MASYITYAKDVNGSPVIPASQRPDGTWRKPRRVREGYVPQEEVPLYESKGKLFAKTQSKLPPGVSETVVKPKPMPLTNSQLPLNKKSPIPGLVVDEDFVKKLKTKKKTKNVDQVTEKLARTTLKEPKPTPNASNEPASTDPLKRIKNLKKKLREIEALELRIKSGEIKNPEKEQTDKISRKKQIQVELKQLENND